MFQSGGDRRRSKVLRTGKPKRKQSGKSPRRRNRSRRQRRVRSRRAVKGRKDKMLGHLPLGEEFVVEELPKRVQARQLHAQRPLGDMPRSIAPRPRGSASTPPPTPSSPPKFRVVSPSKTSEPQPEPSVQEGEPSLPPPVAEGPAFMMGDKSSVDEGTVERWLEANNIIARGTTAYLIERILYRVESEGLRPYDTTILDARGKAFKTVLLACRLEAIDVENVKKLLRKAGTRFPKEDPDLDPIDRHVALVRILLSDSRGRAQLLKAELSPGRKGLPTINKAHINAALSHLEAAHAGAEKARGDWNMSTLNKLFQTKSERSKKFLIIKGILVGEEDTSKPDLLETYVDKNWVSIDKFITAK